MESIPRERKEVKNILYLGWLGKGNMGDDLLFELFKQMFLTRHRAVYQNTAVNIDMFPPVAEYRADVSRYDLIVLGGGSLIDSPFWLGVCQEGIDHGIPVVSWGTGADGISRQDTLDSVYLPDQEADWFLSVYEKFDYISVRGPYTKHMLLNSGLKKDIHEIGDPALAYTAETTGEKTLADAGRNSKTILVNWGTSGNNVFGKNEAAVEEELVISVKKLIAKGYEVICYPVWTEDIDSVKRLAKKVNDNRCRAITEVYEPRMLQQLISQCCLSINLKLHANIVSASANRPFLSLGYRGKCFDFAATVNCLEYVVATDQVTAGSLIEKVEEIEGNYGSILERFDDAKEKYVPRVIDSICKISAILNEQDTANPI